jgi:hypothetical protein
MSWDDLHLYLYGSEVVELKTHRYSQKLEKGKSTFVPVLGFLKVERERNSDVRERLYDTCTVGEAQGHQRN